MKKQKDVVWTLGTAHEFVRELEHHLEPVGWHVALAGSVLHKGESTKDLDIIVYPHRTNRMNFRRLYAALWRAGLALFLNADQVKEQWAKTNAVSKDEKHVEVWYKGARRVDVFVLS